MACIAHRLATRRHVVVSFLLALCASLGLASEPPVSLVNPQTGHIETVDAALHDGLYAVRHTTTLALNRQLVEFLTAPAADDCGPRIAASPRGDLWVTWWRDTATPEVVVVKQTYPGSTWSAETVISASGESSSRPRIVHDGATVWIAYEIAMPGVTLLAVTPGGDPNPWPSRSIVAKTSFAGDRDLAIAVVSGHLWITWVDSGVNVGWSEYDYDLQAWAAPKYESYAVDSVDAARERVRGAVLEE